MAAICESELELIRADFPLLSRSARGNKHLAYFDSSATSQKPHCVLEAVTQFYELHNGAINRGTHLLADEATLAFEDARKTVAEFVGASPSSLVWTKNATEAVNLVAYGISNAANVQTSSPPLRIGPGDEICVTRAEHHANLVPWQQLCVKLDARLTWLDLLPDGRIDLDTLERINSRTKLVAFTHLSNVTGALSPAAEIITQARKVGALVFLDTCQSAARIPLCLQDMDIDFAILSGHKMAGPTGIGALYAREEILTQLPPFLTGGSIVKDVTMEVTEFQEGPARFEAGTQPVAQAIGWAKACEYIGGIGLNRIAAHEEAMTDLILEGMASIDAVRVLGPDDPKDHLGVVSFDINGIHPHDVGQILDDEGVAVRVGHHCAIPLHRHFGVRASTRASVCVTTTPQEVTQLLAGIERVVSFFRA